MDALGELKSLVPDSECVYNFNILLTGSTCFSRKILSSPFDFSPLCVGEWVVELRLPDSKPGFTDSVGVKFISTDDRKLYGYFPSLCVVCSINIYNYNNAWIKTLLPAVVSTETKLDQVDHPNVVINMELSNNSEKKIDFLNNQFRIVGTFRFYGKQSIQSREIQTSVEQSDLVHELKSMYKNTSTCDVSFTFGNDRSELKAHKFILVTRSPVFAAMFKTDMLEKKSNCIPIDDFDRHTFDSFLLFLYSDEIQDKNWDTVLALYAAAGKYQVAHLRKICSRIIRSQLNPDNVCCALVQADLHGDAELKDAAKHFLMGNFKEVSSTDVWDNLISKYPALATEIFRFMTTSMVH